MEEYFDILDEKGNYTGKIETRKKCHKEGLYHKAVVVFIMNSKGQVLLQILLDKRDITFLGASISSNIKGDIVNHHFNEYYIANKEIDETKLKLQEEEVSAVKWIDKDEIIEKIKDNYNGITDKEGCWKYLIKYYEWLERNERELNNS